MIILASLNSESFDFSIQNMDNISKNTPWTKRKKKKNQVVAHPINLAFFFLNQNAALRKKIIIKVIVWHWINHVDLSCRSLKPGKSLTSVSLLVFTPIKIRLSHGWFCPASHIDSIKDLHAWEFVKRAEKIELDQTAELQQVRSHCYFVVSFMVRK